MAVNVQNVFNKVINSGCYNENNRRHMCRALAYASNFYVITPFEYECAQKAIEAYLGMHSYLILALKETGLPHEFQDRLHIYRNWENRPELKQY